MRKELTTKEIYNKLKNSAKKRGIEFELSLTDLNEITFPITCPVFGIPLKWNSGKAADDSYSFDRIDSTKGYNIENIIITSWKANRLKNNASQEDLLKISKFYEDYFKILK